MSKIVHRYKSPDFVEWEIHKNRARMAFGNAKWKKMMQKGREYLKAIHEFALIRGDADTGRRRTMLGREAKALNDDYERKYMDSKTPRLYRWKWLRTVKASPSTATPEDE